MYISLYIYIYRDIFIFTYVYIYIYICIHSTLAQTILPTRPAPGVVPERHPEARPFSLSDPN